MKHFFDKIYCINLPQQVHRKERFINEFATYFDIQDKVEFVDGVIYKENVIKCKRGNGVIGCLLAHYHAIKKAFESGANNVLIFEDDVCLPSDLDFCKMENLLQSIEDLKKLNWDVFYLGFIVRTNLNKRIKRTSRRDFNSVKGTSLVRIKQQYGCHAYALNLNGMEKVIEIISNMLLNKKVVPIDNIIGWTIMGYDFYCCRDFFITQDSLGGSNIGSYHTLNVDNYWFGLFLQARQKYFFL